MNKNEETSESWHSNLLNKFRNITIGAAMAESPAVMIASGWRQNNKGDYVQDQQDSEGVKQLRDNLSSISEMSPTNPAGVTLFGIGRGNIVWVIETSPDIENVNTPYLAKDIPWQPI